MKYGEIAVAVADLMGFIGAILLAIPFFSGQRARDMVLIALARPSDPIFDQETQGYVSHIGKHWHKEWASAWGGATLIGLAFLIRLVVTLTQL